MTTLVSPMSSSMTTSAVTVTGFVERALAFFAGHGIVVMRLMTDNGFSYVRNRSLRELLAARGIRHLTTQPDGPRTNGKVERFHQTMAREWAYGLALPLTSTTKSRPATVARPLQSAQTAQLDRRPGTDQPRSQRLWVGHLMPRRIQVSTANRKDRRQKVDHGTMAHERHSIV